MDNPRLFKETFSALHVSEETISEVMNMTRNQNGKILRLRRSAACLAACLALTLGLAVTANAATGGELFEAFYINLSSLTQINRFKQTATDEQGREVTLIGVIVDVLSRDGRCILAVGEEEIDITDQLSRNGSYTYECTDNGTVCRAEVTGTPEQWRLRYSIYDQGEQPDMEIVRSWDDPAPSVVTEDGEVLFSDSSAACTDGQNNTTYSFSVSD